MIHITLGDMKSVEPEDDFLGRSVIGWSPGMTDDQLYEAGRGCWVLGARADRERYALLSAHGIVRQAIRIEGIAPAGPARRAIEGTVLKAGEDPVHDAFVGKPSPVEGARNPITYFDSPHGARTCACGCDARVALGHFLPGHDQIALHKRVARIGTVYEFINWFDETHGGLVDKHVYVTASGDKWHLKEDCPGIKAGQRTAGIDHKVEATGRARAAARGKSPCGNCATGP
ncbi:hypothetical protein [Streptomyces sp. NPDC060022]|uniref:hypothetical protein n=1 Tax=Streptomyces sp. NPDC060022 TaxID=3347039 RepID=UPI0036B8DA4D